MSNQKDLTLQQTAGLNIPAIGLTVKFIPQPPTLRYCGRHQDGRFRLKIGDQKYLVNGAIYALSKSNDHMGTPLWFKLLLDMTPGYRITKNDELSFDVFCEATGARMVMMGQATPFDRVTKQQGGEHG